MSALSPDDVATCIRVLEAVGEDRGRLADLDAELRLALLMAAGKVARPDRIALVQMAKVRRRQQRAERRAHDVTLLGKREIRMAREAPIFVPPAPRLEAGAEAAEPAPELREPKSCYVCKRPFSTLHFFYDSMCPPCADLNYRKRHQTASLEGRVAVITGARLKIGYQTSLMMLRAGARVIATTRFPHDAARRYAREPDFGAFSERLQIHGLDLRHAPSVELFVHHLDQQLGRLDLLVNNAAQTVRRPPAFYSHLIAGEERAHAELEAPLRPLLAAHEALKAELRAAPARLGEGQEVGMVSWRGGAAGVGLLLPAQLSQLPIAPGDAMFGQEVFPMGAVDGDLQQVDLRTMNSWRLGAAEVSTPELLEVHLVNAIAPFILTSKLKALMMRERTDDKHIVNVSAMEAKFARHKKTSRHPHTNMAKAALNMLTRTSAADYAQDGIFMNSVDTGWVTDEDPLQHVSRKQVVHDFHPPLDVVDGAARVCDPFFSGLLSGQHSYGVFFKDYAPAEW